MHIILGCLLIRAFICQAASVIPESVNNVNVHDMLTTVSYKLEVYTKTLSELDTTVKSLAEKAHNWAIFRHHIDVWNMQMHTMEQKLNALQRGQDNKHGLGAKLTKVENTLNQILNQIELTVDNCQSHKHDLISQNIVHERSILNKDYAKATNALKKVKNEAVSRLNNILRYLQKTDITKNNCATALEFEGDNNLIMGNYSQKDLRHFQEETKKNTKNLEMVVKNLLNVQKKFANWQDNAENNVNYMTKQCQSATKELSTFTESSDLLLKRIETLMQDFGEKLHNVNWHFTPVSVHNQTDGEVDKENNEEDMNLSTTDATSNEENDAEQTFHIYANSNEMNYMQSHKNGCHELVKKIDGIYMFGSALTNEAGRDFNERLCIFTQEGLAWTVIQNRGPYEEQENFNRGWDDYRSGFGELHKDFWFGNDFIHKLTHQNDYELRIELEDCAGTIIWAEYKTFQIEDENSNYALIIDDFRGNATDAMSYYNEMDFSTFDHAAALSHHDCSAADFVHGGGWWFTSCADANLNGIYVQSSAEFNYDGIFGKPWREDYSLKRTRMMIRPTNWKVDISTEDP